MGAVVFKYRSALLGRSDPPKKMMSESSDLERGLIPIKKKSHCFLSFVLSFFPSLLPSPFINSLV